MLIIVSGEPLFSSSDKSIQVRDGHLTKPIKKTDVIERSDDSLL